MSPITQALRSALQDHEPRLLELSHRIHAHPELAFEEHRAAAWCEEVLAAAGYAVEHGVAGLATAFRATIGTGDLVIGLCAEYDALPGIGHACGHNIIAASAVGAAGVLAPLVDELGLTVVVLGTPAEERGGGKIHLLEAGAFDGLHCSMLVHPAPVDVVRAQSLAVQHLDVTFEGVDAHASAAPHRGVNAADALVVAQVGIGLMRQQLRRSEQVHGIVTHGGDAPNIVPGRTTASYDVRGRDRARVERTTRRVQACFEAGAHATGCTASIRASAPYAELRHHAQLGELARASMAELGRRPVDQPGGGAPVGATDMGNVSQVLPTIHPMIGIDTRGAVNHHPDFTAACASPSADRAVLDGAALLAGTAAAAATGALRRQLLTRSAADE